MIFPPVNLPAVTQDTNHLSTHLLTRGNKANNVQNPKFSKLSSLSS